MRVFSLQCGMSKIEFFSLSLCIFAVFVKVDSWHLWRVKWLRKHKLPPTNNSTSALHFSFSLICLCAMYIGRLQNLLYRFKESSHDIAVVMFEHYVLHLPRSLRQRERERKMIIWYYFIQLASCPVNNRNSVLVVRELGVQVGGKTGRLNSRPLSKRQQRKTTYANWDRKTAERKKKKKKQT